jgi:HSP20 family protein
MGWDGWRQWFERRRRRFPFFGGWYLRDIEENMRDMERMMGRELTERVPSDLVRERTLPNGSEVKQWVSFVYGYSVRTGLDGKPKIREFGNVKPGARMGRPRIEVKEQREPLVDILEIDDEVRVVIELPGV